MGLGDWMLHALSDFLQKPIGHYEQRGYNDFERLKEVSRKGDVLLVEGDQRVSAIIKLLTHSSWSHAALYIGDELLQRGSSGSSASVSPPFGSRAWTCHGQRSACWRAAGAR